jgi:DNA-binding MurR/RpiR family transcriptional regulator
MSDTRTDPDKTDKPQSVDAFRARLLNERHLFTNRMLEAGAWVLDNQRIVALETLSVMTRKSKFTPSIFVRLAKAMGFVGFSDMQKLFRAPLHEVYSVSLSERISHSQGDEVVHDPADMRAVGQSFCRANSATLAHLGGRLDELPLDAAVDRIIAARTVHLIGLDRSFPVASYFSYALRRARVQAVQITGMGSLVSDQVAITDSPVSPITEGAAEVLTVDDAELHGFRSLTGVMSLVQTLAIGLAYRCRDRGGLDLDLINA